MLDSLFVPERCITHITSVGEMIRDNRKIFLHLGSWHRYRGYAHQTMHKIDIKNPLGLSELLDFEDKKGLPHSISEQDVEDEIKRRKLRTTNII